MAEAIDPMPISQLGIPIHRPELPDRPNLVFITENTFETMDEFIMFTAGLDKNRMRIIINCITSIPKLIGVAETHFDENASNQGISFQGTKTVLEGLVKID